MKAFKSKISKFKYWEGYSTGIHIYLQIRRRGERFETTFLQTFSWLSPLSFVLALLWDFCLGLTFELFLGCDLWPLAWLGLSPLSWPHFWTLPWLCSVTSVLAVTFDLCLCFNFDLCLGCDLWLLSSLWPVTFMVCFLHFPPLVCDLCLA